MSCDHAIKKVREGILAEQKRASNRERLKPLFDAGWEGIESAGAVLHVRREQPALWVEAYAEDSGDYKLFGQPGDGRWTVKRLDEVLEFAEGVRKAAEDAGAIPSNEDAIP